jgi:transposase InsO family protein
MDFAEASTPIDGLYPYLLAVRDLASGMQLLWLPIEEANTQKTLLALAHLFVIHGAPLVLKSDNGSAFGADALLAFLHQAGVFPLFSPPYTPSYNGAIEAGIGSLKTRTDMHAARHGRPGQWTWDGVAAARHEANATARPHGETGPTPDQLWEQRHPITADERTLFHHTVEHQRQDERSQPGWTMIGPLSEPDQRRLDRQALRRALVQHAYLLFSRRQIPLPFNNKKVTNIT